MVSDLREVEVGDDPMVAAEEQTFQAEVGVRSQTEVEEESP